MNNDNEYHKLIVNVDDVQRFHDLFIKGNLENDKMFTVMLFKRQKYVTDPEIKIKNGSVYNRKCLKTDNFQSFLTMLYSYEMNTRALLTSDYKIIPTNCVGLYMVLNGNSGLKAYRSFTDEMDDILYRSIKNPESVQEFTKMSSITLLSINILDILNSCIQSSVYEKEYIQIDIDDKNEKYYNMVKEYLKENGISSKCIIETRGGYHFILELSTLSGDQKKSLNNPLFQEKLDGKNIIKLLSDQSIPIPGTMQGGFLVKFIAFEK